MELAYFEMKKNVGGKYFFSFKRSDGRMILVSQSFSDRLSLEQCIQYLRDSVPGVESPDTNMSQIPYILINHDKSGEYNFTMIGDKNVVILKSEGYKEYEQCKESINFFLENSKNAKIIDKA